MNISGTSLWLYIAIWCYNWCLVTYRQFSNSIKFADTKEHWFYVCVHVFVCICWYLCCVLPAPTGSAPGPWSRHPSSPCWLLEVCMCPVFSSSWTRSRNTGHCHRCFESGQCLTSKYEQRQIVLFETYQAVWQACEKHRWCVRRPTNLSEKTVK